MRVITTNTISRKFNILPAETAGDQDMRISVPRKHFQLSARKEWNDSCKDRSPAKQKQENITLVRIKQRQKLKRTETEVTVSWNLIFLSATVTWLIYFLNWLINWWIHGKILQCSLNDNKLAEEWKNAKLQTRKCEETAKKWSKNVLWSTPNHNIGIYSNC